MKIQNKKEIENVFKKPKIFIGLFLLFSEKHEFYLATRIQKAFFLFIKEILPQIFKKISVEKQPILETSNDLDFIPYDFGPYSKSVDQTLMFFGGAGIVKISIIKKNFNNLGIDGVLDSDNLKDELLFTRDKMFHYKLSPKYENDFLNTKEEISKLFCNKEQEKFFWNEFENFVKRINKTNINKILFYVYTKYPDYAENSIIKDKVLKND